MSHSEIDAKGRQYNGEKNKELNNANNDLQNITHKEN